MEKIIAMAGVAGLVLIAGAACAQTGRDAPTRFGQMDRADMGPMASRMMERMRDRGMGLRSGLMLRAADLDQDGVATRAEIDALAEETFAWNDRNGDGVLDEADAGPMAQRLASLRPEPTDDPWSRRGRPDADNDGRVTRADIAARTDALFERLDADGDGAISAEEAQAAGPGRRGGPGARL